jgi:hypothetical protein
MLRLSPELAPAIVWQTERVALTRSRCIEASLPATVAALEVHSWADIHR